VGTSAQAGSAEPPYGVIWNRLKSGKVVPFLGAGASFVNRPPGAKWSPQTAAFLPSGWDLSSALADEAEFPSADDHDRGDLAKVTSYYVEMAGRAPLRERLREMLNHPYSYGPIHEFLAKDVRSPLVIVVTNYDTLVEQAFQDAGKPYDLVVYPADRKDIANSMVWWRHGSSEPDIVKPNELDIDLKSTNVIYKMHGTILRETEEWDSFVITEEDYVEFLSRMTMNMAVPSLFYPHFRERSFLFLGYSLRDWNLRVVLKNMSKLLTTRRGAGNGDDEVLPSWSIQLRPSELELRLWASKRVNIFNLTLDEFVARLRQKAAG
jgi:hypothetical protein